MLFPGVRKLSRKLGFYKSSCMAGGVARNSVVFIWDEASRKVVELKFPARLDEDAAESIRRIVAAHKAKVRAFEEGRPRGDGEDDFLQPSVSIEFPERFIPCSTKRIESAINGIAAVVFGATSGKEPVCQNCGAEAELKFYETSIGLLAHICRDCFLTALSKIEAAKSEFDGKPGNYMKAGLGAAVFSLLGILISMAMYLLGSRIHFLSICVYFALAEKAYSFLKGKPGKAGVLICAFIVMAESSAGLFLSPLAKFMLEFKSLSLALSAAFSPDSLLAARRMLPVFAVCGFIYPVLANFAVFRAPPFLEIKEARKA